MWQTRPANTTPDTAATWFSSCSETVDSDNQGHLRLCFAIYDIFHRISNAGKGICQNGTDAVVLPTPVDHSCWWFLHMSKEPRLILRIIIIHIPNSC